MSFQDQPEQTYKRGLNHYENGDLDLAVHCFNQVIEDKPDFVDAHVFKGNALFKSNELIAALSAYKTASIYNPDRSYIHVRIGLTCYELGRYQEAIDALLDAIIYGHTHPDVFCHLGNAQIKLGQFDEALYTFDQFLSLNTDDGADKVLDSIVLLFGGDLQPKLFKLLDLVLTHQPSHILTIVSKAMLLNELGQYQEALDTVNVIDSTEIEKADFYSTKGVSLSMLGRIAEALVCCDIALEADPAKFTALLNKQYCLIELKRYEEALASIDQALEVHPKEPKLYAHKGASLYGVGDLEDSLEAFDLAIEYSNETDASLLFNKGTLLSDLSRCEESIPFLNTAIQLSYRLAEAHYTKAVCLLKLNHHQKAKQSVELALLYDPSFAKAWVIKSLFHQADKEWYEAQNCCEKYFSLRPTLGRNFLTSLRYYYNYVDAPLLVIWLENQLPEAFVFAPFDNWSTDVRKAYAEDLSYLAWLSTGTKNHLSFSGWESKREQAIINFYRGNPIVARQLLDEIDRVNEYDFKAQYYLIQSSLRLSLQDGDCKSLISNAVSNVREFPENITNNVWQTYYAGQILCLDGLWEEAEKTFSLISNQFIPALYMQYWGSQQLRGFDSDITQDLFRRLLFQEETLWSSIKQDQTHPDSFIRQVMVSDWFLESEYWVLPWLKYACAQEIVEPLQSVATYLYNLLEEEQKLLARVYKANQRSEPTVDKPYFTAVRAHYGRKMDLKKYQNYYVSLNEKEKQARLEAAWIEIKQNEAIDLEVISALSQISFTLPSAEREKQVIFLLSTQLDRQDGLYSTAFDSYASLVEYTYIDQRINAYTFLTATYYVVFRASVEFTKGKIEAAMKRFDGLLTKRAYLNKLLKYMGMPALVTDLVEEATELIGESVKEFLTQHGPTAVKTYLKYQMEVENMKVEKLTYKQFRQDFAQFVVDEQQRLGDEFERVYGPSENWIS